MSDIRLTNTLTRQVEVLEPLVSGQVGVYLCGPTVYDLAHLGNARSAVNFDMLHRLLRHDFGVENVTFVRNITDVDDKIIARSIETDKPIGELTAASTKDYLDDLDALGVLPVTDMPRATEYIAEMIAMIEDLIAKGHAYVAADGNVLFHVPSMPGYGGLSRRSQDDIIAGAEDLATQLETAGMRVMIDDRKSVSVGVKFNDAELLGIPTIVIVGKALADGEIEVKDRRTGDRRRLPVANVVAELTGN